MITWVRCPGQYLNASIDQGEFFFTLYARNDPPWRAIFITMTKRLTAVDQIDVTC